MCAIINNYISAKTLELNADVISHIPANTIRLRYEQHLSNCDKFETQLMKINKSELLLQPEASEEFALSHKSLLDATSYVAICGRLKLGIPIPDGYFDKNHMLTVYHGLTGCKKSKTKVQRTCLLFILYNPEGLSNYIDDDGVVTCHERIWAADYYKALRNTPDPVRMPQEIGQLLNF